MYPIRFEPVYKDYVWGGARIAKEYSRASTLPLIAESWELADRPDGMSVVLNGPLKGKTLNELVLEMGEALLGVGQKANRFPLLLKIIDAKQNLSVQVHPDHTKADKLKGEPKTEMWVVLDEAVVYSNLKKGVTEDQFQHAIETNKAEDLLEQLVLKKGEAVFIPGGRVHAICAGSLLFEVQQNSNTTYRLYDWGRKGRELHLKEGFSAIHWDDLGHAKAEPQHVSSDAHHQLNTLVSSPFFVVDRLDVFERYRLPHLPKTFQILFCMEGSGSLQTGSHEEPLVAGVTYLIPASCRSVNIEGKCQLLRVRMP